MKLGEFIMRKYASDSGEWEDGKKITFDNCSKKQKEHCSISQLINIEAQEKFGEDIMLVKTGKWGNETYFDIVSLSILEKNGYERIERPARDDYFRRVYKAERYYQDSENIPKDTKSVLSRVYPSRQYADYINFTSEKPTSQEIANANKIKEDDFKGVIDNLLENYKENQQG